MDPLENLVNYMHIDVFPLKLQGSSRYDSLVMGDSKYSYEYNKNYLHHQIMKQCDLIDNMLNETLNISKGIN